MHVSDMRPITFMILWYISLHMQLIYRNISIETYKWTILLHLLNSLHCFQGCVMTHNAMHVNVFDSTIFNRIYRILLSIWQGGPVSTYESGHNKKHHIYLETNRDPTRCTKVQYDWDIVNILLFFVSTVPEIVENDNKYIHKAYLESNWKFLSYFLIEFITHICFTGTCTYVYGTYKTLIVYTLPTLGGKIMIITLNFLQHDGCDIKHKYNHSRNFTGYILNFLCCNNGFHTVHHNNPRLHWRYAKKEHSKIAHNINKELCYNNIVCYIIERMVSRKRTFRFQAN